MVDSNIPRSTPGDGAMGMASCVRTSVGVGRDKEGESQDRQRE